MKAVLIKSDFSLAVAGFAREVELEAFSSTAAEKVLQEMKLIKSSTIITWSSCKPGQFRQLLGEVTVKGGHRIQFLFCVVK